MAEKVRIEIEAHFTDTGLDKIVQKAQQAEKSINNLKKSADSVGKSTSSSSKPLDNMAKSATKAETALKKVKTAADRVGKTKADIMVKVKDKASSVLNKVQSKLKTVAGGKVYNALISAKDRASSIISKPLALLKQMGSGTWKALIYAKDHASEAVSKVKSGLKSIAGKTWNVAIKAKDGVTGIIRGITNSIFSLKTAIAGVMSGMALNQFVLKPIQFADTMENSFIGFKTMLGSGSAASAMIDDIKNFARTTPLDTTGVISSVQQMINAGIGDLNEFNQDGTANSNYVMKAIEKIGNAAMATGGGTEGMKGITTALSQMMMTGKVNAQDMMQLANRGIPAWKMLADYFKVSVQEVREMSKEGDIAAEDGIAAIMQGFERYDGMMTMLSKRTASGIWSNIKDTFQLSIVEKWGKGLQHGAIKGLTTLADWLDKISPKLDLAGASLEKLGESVGEVFSDFISKGTDKITDILDSDAFKNADGIGAKMKVLFKGIFSDAWDATKKWLEGKAPEFGDFLGRTLSKGIVGIADFITGALGGDTSGIDNAASRIGASFWDAFCEAFDGEKVKDAVWRAIKSVFSSAGKFLPGGAAPDIGSVAALYMLGKTGMLSLGMKALGAGGKLFKNTVLGGSWIGKATVSGTDTLLGGHGLYVGGKGLMGLGAQTAKALGYTSTSAGMMSAVGLGSLAGGIAAGTSLVHAGNEFQRAYNAHKKGDKVTRNANLISGTTTAVGTIGGGILAGMAAGAGAGALAGGGVFSLPAALIGAGIGGLTGWWAGHRAKKAYMDSHGVVEATDAHAGFANMYGIERANEKITYSTERMKKAIEDTTLSAEDLGKEFESAVNEDMVARFGTISMSLEEIDTLAKDIAFGKSIESMEQLENAIINTQQSLSSLKSSKAALEKWNLRAQVGLEVKGADSIDSYKADVESFVGYAKQYVEDMQLEQTAALNVLLGVDTDASKSILEGENGLNQFYADIQNQLKNLEVQVDEKIKLASEDGVITLDEQAEIANLTNQINEIINKISLAESNAELDLIKLKFGQGNMTADNFADFQTAISEYAQTSADSYGTAYIKAKAALDLKFEGETDSQAYKDELAKIEQAYQQGINDMKVRVNLAQIEIMSSSYADLFGGSATEAATALNNALQEALNTGTDPLTWTVDDIALKLGVESLPAEAAEQLRQLLSNIYNNQPTTNAEVPVEVTPVVTQGEPTGETTLTFPTTTATQNVEVTPNITYTTGDRLAMGKGPISNEYAQSLTLPAVSATQPVNVTNSYNTLNPYTLPHIDTSTTADVDVTNSYSMNDPTFGPYTGSANASVTITASYSLANQPTISAANGFVTVSANGRIADKPTLSWLAEEGWPEAVIPFNPARRQRALDLWTETGRRLGVMNHANGGIVGDSSSENPYNPPSADLSIGSSENTSRNDVKIEVGGITIQVEGSNGSLLDNIEEQGEAIVEKIADILNKSVSKIYANTPTRGRA